MSAVRLVDLRQGYGDSVVLDGLSMDIAGGEFVALVGRSGSGKSTLLNVIAGLELLSGGEVWIGDTRTDTLEEPERTLHRRGCLGFVFQAFNLLPTLTVIENVTLPLALNPDRGTRDGATDLLERLGLGGFSDRYPETLSGGEQQRVAIARALVHQPTVVLADEPTGNLDHATGLTVFELLRTLCRERRTTLVLATHDRELADRADRVVSLVDGKLELRAT